MDDAELDVVEGGRLRLRRGEWAKRRRAEAAWRGSSKDERSLMPSIVRLSRW
jgi:hypothetical protein